MVAGTDDDEDNGPDKNAIAALFEAAGIGREVKPSMKVEWNPIATHDSEEETGDEEEQEDDDERIALAKAKKKKGGTFQDYLEKRRFLRKERKQQIKEIKAKSKLEDAENKKQIVSQILEKKKSKKLEALASLPADTNDERFSALFENPDFAIDKANKKYKGGNLADRQVELKQERKRKRAQFEEGEEKPEVVDSKALIQKLKMKTSKIKRSL